MAELATGGPITAGLPLFGEYGCTLVVPRHRPALAITATCRPVDPAEFSRAVLAVLRRTP